MPASGAENGTHAGPGRDGVSKYPSMSIWDRFRRRWAVLHNRLPGDRSGDRGDRGDRSGYRVRVPFIDNESSWSRTSNDAAVPAPSSVNSTKLKSKISTISPFITHAILNT